MSKLQKLLDNRFPLDHAETEAGRDYYEKLRAIFTEGYNAAKAESDPVYTEPEWGSKEDVENKVRMLRGVGKRIEALKYFRQSPYSVGGLKDDKDYCESL